MHRRGDVMAACLGVAFASYLLPRLRQSNKERSTMNAREKAFPERNLMEGRKIPEETE